MKSNRKSNRKSGGPKISTKYPQLTQEIWDRIMRETPTGIVRDDNWRGCITRGNLKRDLSIYRDYTSFNVSCLTLATKWRLSNGAIAPICEKVVRLMGFRREGGCWVPIGQDVENC